MKLVHGWVSEVVRARRTLAARLGRIHPGRTTPTRRLVHDRLESRALGGEVDFAVYTPPGWSESERLPLVLFLHGVGDGADCLDVAGVGALLDDAMGSGRIPRAVVAVPDGGIGFWENWRDGSRAYRDWVIRELLPTLHDRYRAGGDPSRCHLLGISMGGHGALRFALLEPDRFASVAAISAPILDTERIVALRAKRWWRLLVPMERIWGPLDDRARIESEDLFRRWTAPRDLGGLRLILSWGTEDWPGIRAANERFRAHLEAHGIPHAALVYEGRHLWISWAPVLERILRLQLGEAGGEPPA